jgi:hypothetical protein
MRHHTTFIIGKSNPRIKGGFAKGFAASIGFHFKSPVSVET